MVWHVWATMPRKSGVGCTWGHGVHALARRRHRDFARSHAAGDLSAFACACSRSPPSRRSNRCRSPPRSPSGPCTSCVPASSPRPAGRSRLAAVVLVRRARAHRRRAVLAARRAVRRALLGAHGRAPAHRRPRRAAARPRAHRAAARAAAARAPAGLDARARAPRAGLLVVGGRSPASGTWPARTRRPCATTPSRAPAHALRRPGHQHVDGAARPAAQAGVVRQRREARLHRRRAPDEHGCSRTSSSGRTPRSTTSTRAGERAHDISRSPTRSPRARS